MSTCKTCKWWDTLACHQQFRETGGLDVSENDHHYEAMPKTNQLLARTDGESCLILTGPDFGCIHHQPKTPTVGDGERVE